MHCKMENLTEQQKYEQDYESVLFDIEDYIDYLEKNKLFKNDILKTKRKREIIKSMRREIKELRQLVYDYVNTPYEPLGKFT